MKKLTTTIVAGLLAGNAMAYDIDGLELPLNMELLFEGNFVQALVADIDSGFDEVTDFELQGYGVIDNIDPVGPLGAACVTSNCALTYTFSGINLMDIALNTDGDALDLTFDVSNASFDFWLHTDGSNTDYAVNSTQILEFDTDWATTYAAWNTRMSEVSGNFGANTTTEQYIDGTGLSSQFIGEQKLFSGTSNSEGALEVEDQTIGAGWYFDKEGSTPGLTETSDLYVLSSINYNRYSDSSVLGSPIDLDPNNPNLLAKAALSAYGSHSFATSVPEPSTLAMFSVALLGFGAAARRRSKKA